MRGYFCTLIIINEKLNQQRYFFLSISVQIVRVAITCSNLTIETVEQGVKYVQG